MKKHISLLILIGILLVFNFVVAKNQPSGQPFEAIWNRINQAGPGWDEDRIKNIEGEIDEIWQEIEDLKEPVCAPEQEICDGVDNDCDGDIDEVCDPVIEDNFNSYTNGSVVGQGSWQSYVNGDNFIVQGGPTKEGSKSLFVSSSADSVIVRQGSSLADGRQTIWLNPDFTRWDSNAFFQARLTKGPWATGSPNLSFVAVTFEQDGRVGYSSGLGQPYVYFGQYRYEWSRLDIEWRSSDNKARYRINTETWTAWDSFPNSNYFTDFDYIGFDFSKSSGSGGTYIDFLY